MADIELVIKIPEEMYKWVNDVNKFFDDYGTSDFIDLVKNGTQLPKEHGRLIDADVFEKRLMDARLYYVGEKADDFDLRFAAGLKSAAERLVDAPTIIEADKAESEE